MKCREIMKSTVECISPGETVQQAAQRMRTEGIGFLPVCDVDGKVVGAITDRDIAVRIVADACAATTPVHEVMTREVVSCRPDDSLSKAESAMGENHKSRIMCIGDDGQLVGVISLSDIARVERGGRAARTLSKVSEREARI